MFIQKIMGFFILMLIVYLIQENTLFTDAYPFSNNPSSYLDSIQIKIRLVVNIHSIKGLENCAAPNEFQVNKGKSLHPSRVDCLRTTADLHLEQMRMETEHDLKRFDCEDCKDYGSSFFPPQSSISKQKNWSPCIGAFPKVWVTFFKRSE